MTTQEKTAILTRAARYENLVRRIRRRVFDYDEATLAKAHRIIERCKPVIRQAHNITHAEAIERRNQELLFRTS